MTDCNIPIPWDDLHVIHTVLTPLASLAEQLQRDQFVPGYYWEKVLLCKWQLERILRKSTDPATSKAASDMIDATIQHCKGTHTNIQIIAGAYLDPRMVNKRTKDKAMSAEEKEKAVVSSRVQINCHLLLG